MILLSWNWRGLGHPLSVHTIGRLVNDRRPSLLFLMETKTTVNSVNHILCNKGFVNLAGFDAEGPSGGLWVGWKANLTASVLHQSKHLILLSVIDEFQLS